MTRPESHDTSEKEAVVPSATASFSELTPFPMGRSRSTPQARQGNGKTQHSTRSLDSGLIVTPQSLRVGFKKSLIRTC